MNVEGKAIEILKMKSLKNSNSLKKINLCVSVTEAFTFPTNGFLYFHILFHRFLASLVAVFGEFDISGDLEKKRSVTKNVKRIVVHREYDAATFENDLALLEMESPIHYDTHIGKFSKT